MRSRYSAFVKGLTSYLVFSWHPASCPPDLVLDRGQIWTNLRVEATTAGGATDSHGTVEFVAGFAEGSRCRHLHEVSRFERWDGRWVYVGGEIIS